MAGYFSNHSQSRFLSNSQPNSATTTTTTATALPSQTSATGQSHPSTPGRVRAPISRHFSTSLSHSSSDDKPSSRDKSSGFGSTNGSMTTVHPLRHTWVFWFRQHRAPGNKITNYEEGIKKISACSSIESFWSLWTHLNPPSSLLPTTDYLLFHAGVRRPVWEDPLNLSGGKWIIRLKKGVADRLWEDLVLAVIGDQFDECRPEPGHVGSGGVNGGSNSDGVGKALDGKGEEKDEWPEICGCTISVRQNEDIITLWNRTDGDAKVKERIQSTIRKALNLPPTTTMEYKSNNDSMQDKSSFRIPTSVDRPPLS